MKPLPEECRCSLSWRDLSYFIPLSHEQKKLTKGIAAARTDDLLFEKGKVLAQRDDYEKGVPIPTLTSNDKV